MKKFSLFFLVIFLANTFSFVFSAESSDLKKQEKDKASSIAQKNKEITILLLEIYTSLEDLLNQFSKQADEKYGSEKLKAFMSNRNGQDFFNKEKFHSVDFIHLIVGTQQTIYEMLTSGGQTALSLEPKSDELFNLAMFRIFRSQAMKIIEKWKNSAIQSFDPEIVDVEQKLWEVLQQAIYLENTYISFDLKSQKYFSKTKFKHVLPTIQVNEENLMKIRKNVVKYVSGMKSSQSLYFLMIIDQVKKDLKIKGNLMKLYDFRDQFFQNLLLISSANVQQVSHQRILFEPTNQLSTAIHNVILYLLHIDHYNDYFLTFDKGYDLAMTKIQARLLLRQFQFLHEKQQNFEGLMKILKDLTEFIWGDDLLVCFPSHLIQLIREKLNLREKDGGFDGDIFNAKFVDLLADLYDSFHNPKKMKWKHIITEKLQFFVALVKAQQYLKDLIGIDGEAVKKIENGVKGPSAMNLGKLSEMLLKNLWGPKKRTEPGFTERLDKSVKIEHDFFLGAFLDASTPETVSVVPAQEIPDDSVGNVTTEQSEPTPSETETTTEKIIIETKTTEENGKDVKKTIQQPSKSKGKKGGKRRGGKTQPRRPKKVVIVDDNLPSLTDIALPAKEIKPKAEVALPVEPVNPISVPINQEPRKKVAEELSKKEEEKPSLIKKLTAAERLAKRQLKKQKQSQRHAEKIIEENKVESMTSDDGASSDSSTTASRSVKSKSKSSRSSKSGSCSSRSIDSKDPQSLIEYYESRMSSVTLQVQKKYMKIIEDLKIKAATEEERKPLLNQSQFHQYLNLDSNDVYWKNLQTRAWLNIYDNEEYVWSVDESVLISGKTLRFLYNLFGRTGAAADEDYFTEAVVDLGGFYEVKGIEIKAGFTHPYVYSRGLHHSHGSDSFDISRYKAFFEDFGFNPLFFSLKNKEEIEENKD